MKLIPLLLIGLSGLALAAEPPAVETPPKGLASSDWSSIRAAYEAGRHAIQRQENGTFTARNPGQQWRTEFDGKGFLTTPDHGQWTWGLELTGYNEQTLPPATSAITHQGNKISNQRDAHLTEWFINDTRGLEQGWTIHSRSVGVSPTSILTLTLSLRGNLHPQVSPDSTSVAFQTPSGSTALTYGGLKAWDADGKNLQVRFEPAGKTAIRIAVDDQNARYPITIDPIAQQAYLKAGNNGGPSDDNFGCSVAISGDTVVVGANQEDSGTTGVNNPPNDSASDSGAAYVFIRSGATWSQQAYMKASNTGEGDRFGGSVAVSGDTVVVGAGGEDSATTGVSSTPNESAGASGAAYVFTRSGTTWSQQAYLKASNTGLLDYFGYSVAVSGDTLVVGAFYEDSSTTGVNSTPNESAPDSGAAYIFTRSGTTWSQQAYLKASNAGARDYFGISVAVSGDTVIVGAYDEDSGTTGVNSTPNESAGRSGAAYVFTRSGTTWTQQAYLKASNTGVEDFFGSSVAVSGDTVVVGAASEDSSTTGVNSTPNESAKDSGAAYIFTRSGTTWSQQAYLKASYTDEYDGFGNSVAVSGDTVVVGAFGDDSSTTGVNSTPVRGAFASGAAYVFTRNGTTWSQQAYLKASNTAGYNTFGRSVAVSGDTVVIGATGEDSSTTGVNSTPNDNSRDSGAAYVYTRSGTAWSEQAYLKASNTPSGTGAGDNFGVSVAVSGDTVVVGAHYEDSNTTGVNSTPNENADSSGAAYVFIRSGATWVQQAYLKASDSDDSDYFGGSVAVSGDIVVVGAVGEDSSTTGVNSTPNDNIENSGAAYVFTRNGTTWSQQAYLKASNTKSYTGFGGSVAVSGDTVVIGAKGEDSSTTGVNNTPVEGAFSSGAAYVFTRNGATWVQQAYLKASNTDDFDSFGISVAVSGDTVVVGAWGESSSTTGVNSTPDENASGSGAAYVFTRSGESWDQQAYLKASNTDWGDSFGGSVAVSGDTVVIGATGEDSSTTGVNSTPNDNNFGSSGAAYIFTRNGTIWSQQAYLKASYRNVDADFGGSVAVSGDTVVVGASNEDSGTPEEGTTDSGAAYVFTRSGATWSQQAYLKASKPGYNDQFGKSVAVSGETVVVGEMGEDSGTTGVNSTPNESAGSSGAAYIFPGFGPAFPLPEIAQANSSAITGNSATLGGNVTSRGGPAINGRGVVYSLVSTNPEPAVGGAGVAQLATSGTTGIFTISATGLAPGSTYAFRAYATNSNGTSYTTVALFSTPPYFLTTLASNGTILRSPNLANYEPGSVVTLSAVPDSGAVFQGWSGDLSGTANPATITMDGNKTVTATFFQNLNGALDTSSLTYISGGNAIWFPQTMTTNDGADAAQSGVIGNSQETWFETTVTGPGSLSFRWKVSSESGYDYLEFYMDGVLQPGRISGEVNWAAQSHTITAGSHTLRWRYAKDEIDTSGSDAGWVDQLVWAPSGGYQAAAGAAGLSGNNALPTATPYNDGVKNLLKYAFNMNLSGPDSRALVSGTGNAGLPVIGLTGTGPATMIRVEFLRRKGSGLIYTPMRSSTLAPGSFVAMSGTPVVTSIDDNWERVVVQESANPATLPKSFAMVEVRLP